MCSRSTSPTARCRSSARSSTRRSSATWAPWWTSRRCSRACASAAAHECFGHLPAGDPPGMADDINKQLTKYLTDAHSIEEQALAQLRTAPDIVGDPELSRIFEKHLKETEEQERLV